MKIKVPFIIIGIATAILVTFNNCSESVRFRDDSGSSNLRSLNTVIGNPLTTAAKTVMGELCAVVTRCHTDVTTAQCELAFMNSTKINYQLGLSSVSFSSYKQIIDDESTGTLKANSSATETCLSASRALQCSDSVVQGAYNKTAADPFAGLEYLVPSQPGSCPSLFSQPSNRLEYFVAVTGNDQNDGSKERPWATLNHAADSLTLGPSGTTVHVARGIYKVPSKAACSSSGLSCAINTTRSGTAAAPIIFISDEQGGAKIEPTGAQATWVNSGDYVSIIGFEIVGDSATRLGVFNMGSFVKVVSNHIHDVPATQGCSSQLGSGGVFHGNFSTVHDNDTMGNLIHDIGPQLGNGLASTSYCTSAHGISYRQPGGNVQNNIIYRVATWGISTWASAANINITHNLIFDSGWLDSSSSPGGGGIQLAGNSMNINVSNNIFRNIRGTALEDSTVSTNNSLYFNNLFFSNGADIRLRAGAQANGSVYADPLMIDFKLDGSGNYRLQASSPAIDTGSKSCAVGTDSCLALEDYSGTARPVGAAADLGPFEWHP